MIPSYSLVTEPKEVLLLSHSLIHATNLKTQLHNVFRLKFIPLYV